MNDQKLNQAKIESTPEQRIKALKESDPELYNALQTKGKVAVVSDLKAKFPISINKWGDLHFKKIHKESLQHFSGLLPQTELVMRFEKGQIVITAK